VELFEFITYFETRLRPVVEQLEDYADSVFAPGSKDLESCEYALQRLIQDEKTVTVAVNESGRQGPRADVYLLRNGLAHSLWKPQGEGKIAVELVDYKGRKTIGSVTVSVGDAPALISRIQRRLLLLEMWIAINVIVLSLLPLNQKAAIKVLQDGIKSGSLKRQAKRE
jgi:hypothetical protein